MDNKTEKKSLMNGVYEFTGFIRGTGKKTGFLSVDGIIGNFFVDETNMRKVRHGDLVTAKVTVGGEADKVEILNVVNKAPSVFHAKVSKLTDTVCMVSSRNHLDSIWYYIPPSQCRKLNVGDYVLVELVTHPFDGSPRCDLKRLVASFDNIKAPWLVTKSVFEIMDSASMHYSKEYSFTHSVESYLDLTHLPFYTIDAASTRDMDDSIYTEKQGDNYLLYVAIADPTLYFKEGDDVDMQAYERSITHYLPNYTCHMLPPELSESICSLKQDKISYSVIAKILLSEKGDILSKEFALGMINSRAKLSYDQVTDFIVNLEPIQEIDLVLGEQLRLLNEVCFARQNYRKKNNLVFVEKPEFDLFIQEWEPIDIIKKHRNQAHKMIEEAMIVANIAFAEFVSEKGYPAIFVSNTGFDEEEIGDVADICQQVDVRFTQEYLKTNEGYIDLKHTLADGSNNQIIDYLLRQYQSRSEYTFEASKHLGMGIERYATFTSPIRKYSDCINHRIIKHILIGTEMPTLDQLLLDNIHEALKKDRMSQKVLRDWLYFIFIKSKLESKSEFGAEIIAFNKGGVKVLIDIGIIFFLPYSSFLVGANARLEPNVATGYIDKNGEKWLPLGSSVICKIKNIDIEKSKVIASIYVKNIAND